MNIYVDSHGRWHVTLPDTRLAQRWAVKAIAEELFCRSNEEQTKEEYALYVEQSIVSIPDAEPGFIHFAEYAHTIDRVSSVVCGDCGYTCTENEDFYSATHKTQCE